MHDTLTVIQPGAGGSELDENIDNEGEGIPWWMPLNPGGNDDLQVFPNASAPDKKDIIVQEIENRMTSVRDIIDDSSKDLQEYFQALKSTKVQRRILIDFKVNTRHFLLYTSILLFLVVLTNIGSGLTHFYHFKGYFFNGAVILFLLYGLYVGNICTYPIKLFSKNRYNKIIFHLHFYWIFSWIIGLSICGVAIYYIYKFPNKFNHYCHDHDSCQSMMNTIHATNKEMIIFGIISLSATLIIYIFIIFFVYGNCIANLIINSGHLGGFAYKQDWNLVCICCTHSRGGNNNDTSNCCGNICLRIHNDCYRYRRVITSIKQNCCLVICFQYVLVACRNGSCKVDRNQLNEMKEELQISKHIEGDTTLAESTISILNDKDKLMNEAHHEQLLKENVLRATHKNNYNYRSSSNSGSSGNICSNICVYVMNPCVGILLLFILGVSPLLFLILFMLPFWYCAQKISSKMSNRIPFLVVIFVFCLCVTIPFGLWYFTFTFICKNTSNDNNTIQTAVCLVWSFFHTMFAMG